ncbi:MAG: DUF488 domain-containing protein [Sphingobacterium sp.]
MTKEREHFQIKRIYETPDKSDGYRVLVDRLWPRGVSKEAAKLDLWNKDLAPSSILRKWFDHRPERFVEFTKQYRKELDGQQEELSELRKQASNQAVTLVYAAKDPKINHALILAQVLRGK